MASWLDNWDDGGDYFESDPNDVYDILWGNDQNFDQHAQDLFVEAFFNDSEDARASAYLELVEYMYDRYGLDFEQSFEWEDFREWYERA